MQGEKTDNTKSLHTEEEEAYIIINYIVNFNNCTFNEDVTINQTGKPQDPPDETPNP